MTEPLPLSNSKSSTGTKASPRQLRIVAGFLGVVSLVMAVDDTRHMIEDGTLYSGPWRTTLLVVGSAYLAAAALCWRTVRPPSSLRWRRAIWGCAALLYGTSLGVFLNGLLRGSNWWVAVVIGILFGIVYAGMAFLAIIGFVLEPTNARGSD